jgi:hypothetical protein
MPSTYTGSGIELIGDGEQSGSWGVTTNTNLQIINRLISEAGTIALSGTTHTLTISDGTLSDGQYAVLVFGGSPSGTNTVTISPNDAKRVFIVRNISGQSVVLTQGSGGNVTVPNTGRAIIYCTGAGASSAVVDVSPATPTLAAIGALTPTDGNFIVGNGTTWVAESGNTVLTSIGVTATTAELNVLDGITASTAELNILDGVTATTAELNFTDGVTSNIQTQLNTLNNRTISAGGGLTGGGNLSADRTISHADTSSQNSVNNSGTTFIQDITLDTYGHVTGIGSATVPEGIGVGQTWQSVTRVAGTSYQNTTGRPIQVVMNFDGDFMSATFQVSQDNSTWLTVYNDGGDGGPAGGPSIIIPDGYYYRATVSGGATIQAWVELR